MLALWSAAALAAPVSLALRHEPGDVLVTTTRTSAEMEMPGFPAETEESTSTSTVTVVAEGANTVLRTPIDGTMELPPGATLPPGHVLETVLDARGEIVDVRGLEPIVDALSAGMPPEMRAELERTLNAQVLVDTGAQFRQHLPTEPVRVGDTWKTSTVMPLPMMGELVLHEDCELISVKKKRRVRLAHIRCAMTSELDASAGGASPAPGASGEVDPALAGLLAGMTPAITGTVDMVVDVGLGVLVQTDTVMDMTMSVMGQSMVAHSVSQATTVLQGPRAR